MDLQEILDHVYDSAGYADFIYATPAPTSAFLQGCHMGMLVRADGRRDVSSKTLTRGWSPSSRRQSKSQL